MVRRIAVAMSGGVDSSVVAALLKEQGYDVHGMMMRLWKDDIGVEFFQKSNDEAAETARDTAKKLGIPFDLIDLRDVFKNEIIKDFIEQYQNGITPNPCFRCNQKIKWGIFLKIALERGADALATGHYARIIRQVDGKYHLYKGVDEIKDQSYVLSGLNQGQLSNALLPLGGFSKSEVRKMARQFGLPVIDRAESQDLCFLPNGNYRSFLERNSVLSPKPGMIRKISGEIVGEHGGLHQFTIGQRKGLGSGLGEPHYVLNLNVDNNEVIIGKEADLGVNRVWIGSANWILGIPPDSSSEYEVKIRYKSKPIPCHLIADQSQHIGFMTKQLLRDATPGQIAVIYNGEEVIGSGIILKTEKI